MKPTERFSNCVDDYVRYRPGAEPRVPDQAFDEIGAAAQLCRLPAQLSPELLARLNSDVDPLLERAGAADTDINPVISAFFGDKVHHVSGLAGKSTAFAEEVMCHPLLLAICDKVLLPNCADYRYPPRLPVPLCPGLVVKKDRAFYQ